MMQDEFNSIKVNNEKQTIKAEFGKVQKTEFSENGDMYLHGTNYNANLNQTVKNSNVETLVEAESSTTAVAASGGASGAVTTVSAGGAASGIAASSVSAIVVASSVTITALSVVTGVSIALHNYQCEIDLFISSNQVSYELTINDLKSEDEDYEYDYESYEKEPFSIHVYNNNYDKTQPLYYGYNDGYFDNLTLGQTYNIVVTADSISGAKTLYKDTFTTTAVANFLDFYVDSAFDYYNQVIYAYLDFVDELDQLSDFELTITRVEEFEPIDSMGDLTAEEIDVEPRVESFSATYPLEKKTGYQEVHLDTGDMWIEPERSYQFEFSYKRNNEKIVYQDGEVSFYSAFEGTSEVYGVNFNNEANYLDKTFVLNLIYTDENDMLWDFVLHLSRDDGFTANIPLEKTIDQQIIYAEDYDILLTETYNAALTYTKMGVEETMDLPSFSFADNSGARSIFNSFVFPKTADFLEKTFEVRLDYQDDFKIFHQFVLTINDDFGDFTFEFELDETTELQSVYAPDIDYETEVEYNYSLTCMKDGVLTELDSGRFSFKDKYDRKSQFNSLTINEEGNFLTNVFTVQLDYVDDFEAFDFFSLNFTSASAAVSGGSFDFALEKKTTVQTLDAGENGMSLMKGPYNYTLYVDRYGVTETLTTGSVTFTDNSGASSEFNEFVFDGTANKLTDVMTMRLDYVDDFGLYSDFKLTIHDVDLGYDVEINLASTSEEQSFGVSDNDLFFDSSYTYTLTCTYDGEPTTLDSGNFVLSDNSGAVSEVSAPTISSTADYRARSFQVTLNYQDDFNYFDNFVMTVRDVTTNNETIVNLSKTTEPQTVSFNDQRYNEDTGEYEYDIDIINHTVIYTLSYYDSSVDLTHNVVEQEALPAFTNSLNTEFNGIVSNWQLVEDPQYAGHYYVPMKLDYVDEKGIYGYLEINMYNSNNQQVGVVEFQNEVVPEVGQWIAGSLSTSLSVDELTGSAITFKVEGQLMDEKNPNVTTDDHTTIYTTTQTLTMANNPEVLAVTTDGYVTGSDTYFAAYFSGQPGEFTNTTITIVTTENEYTYNVTLTGIGDTIYVNLTETIDGDIDYDTLVSELGEPVTIKFSYCTVTKTGSDTGPGTEVISDPIELVCYTNFLFTVSV